MVEGPVVYPGNAFDCRKRCDVIRYRFVQARSNKTVKI